VLPLPLFPWLVLLFFMGRIITMEDVGGYSPLNSSSAFLLILTQRKLLQPVRLFLVCPPFLPRSADHPPRVTGCSKKNVFLAPNEFSLFPPTRDHVFPESDVRGGLL